MSLFKKDPIVIEGVGELTTAIVTAAQKCADKGSLQHTLRCPSFMTTGRGCTCGVLDLHQALSMLKVAPRIGPL